MYRGTPPVFDVPEFPTLRRIKPLPKRRRTTSPDIEQVGSLTETLGSLAPQNDTTTAHPQTSQRSTPPLPDSFVPSEIAEELLSRVDNLSTRVALQNYYIPILGNVQNFLASHGASAASRDGASNSATAAASAAAAALAAIAGAGRNGSLPIPPLADIDSIEFGVHFAAAAAAAAAAGLPMGGLGSLGMGLSGINVHMGPASTTSGDGKGDSTSIGAMTPSLLHDGAGLGPTEEYGREERSSREDEYGSHVRQPGNTKKRKVPSNLRGSPRGHGNAGEGGSLSSSYLDEDGSDSLTGGDSAFRSTEETLTKEQDQDRSYDSTPPPVFPSLPFPGQLSILIQKKGKLTAATFAGLQHKEQLKSRKRQLAAAIGALSHGDALALDQALSFNYPFVSHSGEPLKIRKSKRRTVRLARAMNILMERPDRKNRHPDAVPFPESDFAFKCPSLTADRLITTKEETATLRKRFEAELERQASRAAKVAVTAGDGGKPLAKSSRAKRERQERERDRAARAARQKKAKSDVTSTDQTPDLVDPQIDSPATGLGTEAGKVKTKTGKKKKRSALANASNPHHLRNYVPSRLPHSGPVDGLVSGNNILPLPVRFLSAEIPVKGPRGNRKVVANTPLVQITQPAEEWICAFCEYDLFYGDDAEYRKAVRNRKKVLRRRRRAAERAAAAASGGGNTTAKTSSLAADEEYDEYEGATWSGMNEHGNAPPRRNGRWKEAPDKEPTTHA